ncbi:MAG: AAA family ATPase [Methylococcales bacterium]|nr:AAA family ATPase [Methylococcales bacterium]
MRIKKLELDNFRCFKEYELEFSDRFTLLIGDNGSGKTAILEALASTVSKFLEGFPQIPKQSLRPICQDDIRNTTLAMGQTPIKERVNYWMLINAEGSVNQESLDWCVYNLDAPASNSTITTLASKLTEKLTQQDTLLPLLAYYGTGRLWKKTDNNEIETLAPGSRLLGYQDCLNPASNLEQLFRWFKTQELAALQKQQTRHALEAVRVAIISMIPDATRAWWDIDWDGLLIETVIHDKIQTTPFHLLSDGYRNMIGMVADIAYRMATLNPQLEKDVIKLTTGIVLIDEIDLHLHPKWQRQVVGRLLDTFPKIQFVASSHSPFIIQSLYHREDVLLWDLEKAEPVNIDSKSIEDIAENQQGVEIPQQSQRFLDMEKAAEAYYTVLKQIPAANEDEKQLLRLRLDELLLPYSDDPAFHAFLKMERSAVYGDKQS